jgi:hypothetical protein
MRDSSASLRYGRAMLVLALVAPLAIACSSSNQQPATPTPTGTGGGLSAVESAASPLLGSVGNAVPGLSPSQVATGTGALLGLAKQKMSPDQFAEIAKKIPGTDQLISGAEKAGLPSSGLMDSSSLDGVFKSAGITPDQAKALTPAVTSEISKATSPAIGDAFAAAVK